MFINIILTFKNNDYTGILFPRMFRDIIYYDLKEHVWHSGLDISQGDVTMKIINILIYIDINTFMWSVTALRDQLCDTF